MDGTADKTEPLKAWKKRLEEEAETLGICQYGFVPVSEVSFSPQVRELCRMNYCGRYAKCWMCPPAVGSYEDCVNRARQYTTVFVYTTVHPVEDAYDLKGMQSGRETHARISRKITKRFCETVPGPRLILTGDGCPNCRECTYPDRPCRFPGRSFPSVESCGIEVNRLAASAGIRYINGANTVTYFSCIFF